MSNVVICNHCQDMFKSENTTWGEIKGFWNEDVCIDLCDNCKSDLDDWLHPIESRILKDYIKRGNKKKK
ncbi:hypothetical protein LCGC14_1517680 [marine sediment metagenome]|uniref:Uncharacterized protein n=1 Tax=marine sediment metagenome TaxID=412755 RepID=A0A0F9M0R3_9ZZZZ